MFCRQKFAIFIEIFRINFLTKNRHQQNNFFLFTYKNFHINSFPSENSLYQCFLILGLSWDTQADSLQRYFSRYGEVIDCVVMKNNETGRSRGFGFVYGKQIFSGENVLSCDFYSNLPFHRTFADPNNVQRALENCPHNLDGRTIDPK